MTSRKALIFRGGWPGHEPVETSDIAARELRDEGFDVQIHDSLDVLMDTDLLKSQDLIVPMWTMAEANAKEPLPRDLHKGLLEAVKSGVGIGGWHGGMCDAFRTYVEYQFMTGGQWVSHPGGDKARYRVRIGPTQHEITDGLEDFFVTSEQYFMHVDPGVTVLATTHFPRGAASGDGLDQAAQDAADRDALKSSTVMPVTWVKRYGQGRVFYTSLGHVAKVFEIPEALTMLRRGLAWAGSRRA
jgi:type 1 glutamine amidotransferase